MKNPEIYIIGSGAIGKALAVFLQQEKKQVKLVRGSIDNTTNTTQNITVILENKRIEQRITTTTFSNLSVINGIVLITTKSFANDAIAKKIKGDFSIILLQNGLNIERTFNDFNKIYRCVLLSTSQVTGKNEVTFKTVAASPIGNLELKNEDLSNLINHISTPLFKFRCEDNIVKYVWNKAIINCAFNAICPLLETDNGIFNRNPDAEKLAEIVINECVSLARIKGVILDKNEIKENLILISKKSSGQLISTYMDILNQRRTEIESLNLEIARLADEIDQPDLVSNTRLLGQLIQLKSNNYSNISK